MAVARITVSVVIAFVALLLFQCGAQSKKKEVAVEGYVKCQDCAKRGTWSLDGATPLSNVNVAVACKDSNQKVTFSNSYLTDGNGYFYGVLQGVDLTVDGNTCNVKLVSSPDESCNQITNVGAGMNGAPFRFMKNLTHVDLFTAGPFAFLPSTCAGGSTGGSGGGSDGSGGNGGFGNGDFGNGGFGHPGGFFGGFF